MDARINEAVQLALSQRDTAGSHPDVVISPASQRRRSCASTAAPDAQAERPQIEAYGSALPLSPSTTVHGRLVPPGYASVTVEQIVGNSEDLELDFIGEDGEKTLGDALHGIVLWCKADIILIANTTAPVDPDDRPPPHPPSPPSPPEQRATSTPTPPAPEK